MNSTICLQLTVSSAVTWFATMPHLQCDPAILLAECRVWTNVMIEKLVSDSAKERTEITLEKVAQICGAAGRYAARECAMPLHKQVIADLIKPEDLQD